MSRRFFAIYQYLGPAVLGPLAFYSWWDAYRGNLWLALFAVALPVAYAYIVPGVGTNLLKVWEFDTRFRLGRFRPHHGFVFGGATAMILWLVHSGAATGFSDLAVSGLVCASVLGFWNLVYDIKAIEAGMLRVYNQPWAEGGSAADIAMDYAPWFFGGFGLVYGAGVAGAELLDRHGGFSAHTLLWYFPLLLLLSILVPVLGYRRQSLRRHRHSGFRPVERRA